MLVSNRTVEGSDGDRDQGDELARRVFVALCMLVAVAPACSDAEPQGGVIQAGQVDIKLPDGWTVTDSGAVRPATATAEAPATAAAPAAAPGAPGAPVAASGSDDTVPLAKDDPQTAFFKSIKVFQTCLDDNGTTFIGVPDASNPNSPANDPDYLKVLGTCASKSNIVQALQDVQKAQDEMTPAEIEEQNKGYISWRECMIGLGWGIPEPKPDAEGRLFSFGGGGSGPPNFKPPPGEDIIGSDDYQECIQQVTPK